MYVSLWLDTLGELIVENVAMETLHVYCPRVIIHEPAEMGQGYIGAAALHHLEGYHIQSLDLGTLTGDSTRVRPFVPHLKYVLSLKVLI